MNEYIKEIVTDEKQLEQPTEKIEVGKQFKDKNNHIRFEFKDNEEKEYIVSCLKNTLREHKNGLGLAAPQIGISKKAFVINFNGELKTYINPTINAAEDMYLNREGCLSFPDRQFLVPRYNRIKYTAMDPQGLVLQGQLFGMAACVFQHEFDHLEGINISEIGLEIDEDFDKASDEEKDKIFKTFLESVKKRAEETNKQIEADPELKELSDAIKFETAKNAGLVQTEKVELTKEEQEIIKEQLEKDEE